MAGPTYEALFNKFRDDTVVDKVRQYANYTLPAIMADSLEVSASGRVIVERDFQEIGALLINNLSAKLVQILFPTQFPFFQASAGPVFIEVAKKKGLDETAVRAAFARMEMKANERLFLNAGYASLILGMKHLIIAGNTLIHRDTKEATITCWGLQSFATRRDGRGGLLDCILREFTTVEALDLELQAALRQQNSSKYGRPEQQVKLYTRIHRVHKNGQCGYEVSQEVDMLPVGTSSWYPKNLCPWMAPTWSIIPGEHYGRGMVEDYAGGFAKLSSLSEAGTLYAIEMLRMLHLVGAGSGTDVDDIATSESGQWVRGDPTTINAYEAGDAKKLVAVDSTIDRVVLNLAKAFMYQAVNRDAERVTAYELQKDAKEAEFALGGSYSTLSGGLQVPLAHVLMTEVSPDALTGIISGQISPDVTAGIPALGRSSDVQNLLMAGQEMAAIVQISQLDERIDPHRITDIIMSGRSVDTGTIFYTPEQQKANADAKAAAQAAQANLIKAQTLSDSSKQLGATIGE